MINEKLLNDRQYETYLQIKLIVLKEAMDADPELKEQVKAYADTVKEFGAVSPPVYLKEKLEDIDFVVQARMNSKSLQ